MSAAVLARVARPTAVDSCDKCFGRGKVFAKPGELVPCPNGCPPAFSGALVSSPAPVRLDPVAACPGCSCSLNTCVRGGCGHSCCC